MKHYNSIRKPTLPASRAFGSIRDYDRSNERFDIEDEIEWHTDPADDGWDWDAPSERGPLTEIKPNANA